jgi:starch synthase
MTRLAESFRPRDPAHAPERTPKLALLPWGDCIEDFLDHLGLSLEDFASKMNGGWLFGYINALKFEGIQTTIFCFSARAKTPVHRRHDPTGAGLVILPAPMLYQRLRRHMTLHHGWSLETMFRRTEGSPHPVWRVARQLAPYLATPIAALASEIRREGCGAILCQEYESPRFDASVCIGELLRIPVFATFQGGNWSRTSLERWLRPLALRRCAGVIVGSAVEAARIRNECGVPNEKISRTFNALDASTWKPGAKGDARRALGIAETTRVAVWHGRIDVRVKGLDVLMEAWRVVCATRSEQDVLLLLLGTGAEADLDEEIRRTGATRIRWIRDYVLSQAAVCGVLSAGDVYVFPSRREGFPVAPLEAMACGLPVVASSVAGVADIFERGEQDGGIVVPQADPIALAQHLGRLLDDHVLARQLGNRARARVERAFALPAVGMQLRSFFEDRGGFAHVDLAAAGSAR